MSGRGNTIARAREDFSVMFGFSVGVPLGAACLHWGWLVVAFVTVSLFAFAVLQYVGRLLRFYTDSSPVGGADHKKDGQS